jgi:hypothetical protein
MRARSLHLLYVYALVALAFCATIARAGDWDAVAQSLGRKGVEKGGVYKVTFPRTDLTVTVGEVTIDPALALTSWFAFAKMGTGVMVMGDVVLRDDEVAAIEPKLIGAGFEITAIHNHLVDERPAIKYMHVGATGNPATLSSAIREALAVTGTPISPAAETPAMDLGGIESQLGMHGTARGPVLQVSFARLDPITERGMTIPPAMGMSTALNFQMIGSKIASTGDFVLIDSEVTPVVTALIEHGITVTAIHSHMLSETPRLFFLHYWAFDNPERLSRGIRTALFRTASNLDGISLGR